MRAAVSIVIPVYNAQEYLQQCLGNVVNYERMSETVS